MEVPKRGEVVIYPFPYTDLSDRKLRPCLVLSNEMGEDVLLCQITSKYIRADKYSIALTSRDFMTGSLRIPSRVRCNMLFTAQRIDVGKTLGRVKRSFFDKVVLMILKILRE